MGHISAVSGMSSLRFSTTALPEGHFCDLSLEKFITTHIIMIKHISQVNGDFEINSSAILTGTTIS